MCPFQSYRAVRAAIVLLSMEQCSYGRLLWRGSVTQCSLCEVVHKAAYINTADCAMHTMRTSAHWRKVEKLMHTLRTTVHSFSFLLLAVVPWWWWDAVDALMHYICILEREAVGGRGGKSVPERQCCDLD